MQEQQVLGIVVLIDYQMLVDEVLGIHIIEVIMYHRHHQRLESVVIKMVTHMQIYDLA
jgi:hypothetical protein